jgi:hypothetical protein
VRRFELGLVGAGAACWLLAAAYGAGLLPAPGSLALVPRWLYTIAAVAGWLCGNAWVARARGAPPSRRLLLLVPWLLAPPGLFYLLWALVPPAWQAELPIAPLLATGTFAVLFLVPVTLKGVFGGKG